ncbi:ExeM/NucH family extracellular endonuclease [Nonomuraea endophytica]|uniref:ExeM/NucH family extracellular endonuclease n=1 Tax=Nonomuraea endophytica TaxID=714136 RepID=UPI0037CB090F
MTRRATAALVAATLAAGAITGAAPAGAVSTNVVIAEVYGGGGNSGATWSNDFIELYNLGSDPVSLSGWSVQYASAAGTTWQVTPLSGSLPPGRRLLVQEAAGTTVTDKPLPPADATGTIPMSATAGKVALVSSTTALVGSDVVTAPGVIDFIGYGTSANAFEGAPAPAPSNSNSISRAATPVDTDNNAADLAAGAPTPTNLAGQTGPGGGEPTPTPTPTPTANPCDTAPTHQIADVQGAAAATPLAGQQVRVEGVLTRTFTSATARSGFFVQDDTPDANPATSDGLFVFAPNFAATALSVGTRVKVSGTATEFGGATQLSTVTAVDVCGTGTIAAATLTLPIAAADTFERLEGVLVTVPGKLTVSENFWHARYGQLLAATGGRLYIPTDRPGVDPAADLRRSVVIDDGSSGQNPNPMPHYPAGDQLARSGDGVSGLTGVLNQGAYGSTSTNVKYLVHPTGSLTFTRDNARTAAPAKVGGDVRIASFNTLNWFTTLNAAGYPNPPYNPDFTPRGANTLIERDRQLAKEVATLKALNADIVSLMEVENPRPDLAGTGFQPAALEALVDALNTAVGAGTYKLITHPGPGTDAIAVAMIYKPAVVKPVGSPKTISDPRFFNARPPLAQTFRSTKLLLSLRPFTVIANHFKSKSCGDAGGDNADLGQGCWNAQRVLQSQAVLEMIKNQKLVNPLVVGDLNAYSEEDPIQTFASAGLRSVSKQFVPLAGRYSYVFGGASGELDHVLTTKQVMRRIAGATIWHVNADEDVYYDYNTEFRTAGDLYSPGPYRASDHDPLLLGLDLFGLVRDKH